LNLQYKMKKTSYCSLSPDGIGKYYWGDVCKRHDQEYQKYNKSLPRKEIDLRFLEELKEKMPFKFLAYLYYFFVRIFSGASWKRWQYNWYLGVIAIKKKEFR